MKIYKREYNSKNPPRFIKITTWIFKKFNLVRRKKYINREDITIGYYPVNYILRSSEDEIIHVIDSNFGNLALCGISTRKKSMQGMGSELCKQCQEIKKENQEM
jgi:hypothetical protein